MTVLALTALFATTLLLGGVGFFAALIAPLVSRVLPPDHGGRFIRTLLPLSKPDAGITAVIASLHLAKVGATLTQLNKQQADYIGVPEQGPFKAEQYRY